MNIEHLVRMANDIGSFFKAEPGGDDAAHAVMAHMKRFWDPRMRKQIVEHFHAGAAGLEEPARSGVGLLAEERGI